MKWKLWDLGENQTEGSKERSEALSNGERVLLNDFNGFENLGLGFGAIFNERTSGRIWGCPRNLTFSFDARGRIRWRLLHFSMSFQILCNSKIGFLWTSQIGSGHWNSTHPSKRVIYSQLDNRFEFLFVGSNKMFEIVAKLGFISQTSLAWANCLIFYVLF